jgi:hypothetical protein
MQKATFYMETDILYVCKYKKQLIHPQLNNNKMYKKYNVVHITHDS